MTYMYANNFFAYAFSIIAFVLSD